MAFVINMGSVEDGYRELLEYIMKYGESVSPRGLLTKAVRNLTIVVRNPEDVLLTGIPARKMSPQLAALEALQLVGGFTDPDLTVKVVPHYANFRSEDATFHGAYGSRTGPWMADVVRRLENDGQTRQALVNFWDNSLDLLMDGLRDYPCTLSSAFEVDSAGRLNGTTVMRSNDAWLGWPYDIVQHTSLLKAVARYLGLPVGTYTHQVHNMHVYASNFAAVDTLLDSMEDDVVQVSLRGGIGDPTADYSWADVQARAQRICYRPDTVEPQTPEEAWMIEQAKKWSKHV